MHQPPPSHYTAEPTYVTALNNTYYQAASQVASANPASSSTTNSAAQPKVNIDQILDLLKNHLNKPTSGVSTSRI